MPDEGQQEGSQQQAEEGQQQQQQEQAPVVKFTQEDVDRIAGASRSDGRTAAEKDLIKTLGVSTLEEAQTILKAAKDQEEASKTELQKAQDRADAAERERDEARTGAQNARVTSSVERALTEAKVNPERFAIALKNVDRSSVEFEGDEVKGVAEAVAALKEASPEWFTTPNKAADASGGESSSTSVMDLTPAERKAKYAKFGIRVP